MRKEEILERSRNENRNADLYEKEVLIQAGNMGGGVGAITCAVLFVAQVLLGGGTNCGLWAVMISIQAATFAVKAVKLRRKHEIVLAIVDTLLALALAALHIHSLITSSAIL